MSNTHDSNKPARSNKTKKEKKPDSESQEAGLSVSVSVGIDINRIYTRGEFESAAGIGQKRFESLEAAGMPVCHPPGRTTYVSGRQYAEWMESFVQCCTGAAPGKKTFDKTFTRKDLKS